jgi:hypothetical protein
MIPETSAAAVAVRVPAIGYAGVPSPDAAPAAETVVVPPPDGAIAVARAGLPHGLRRVVWVLGDIVGLVAVALAFPLVILAVGIPIALLVRLVIWFVGVV